MGAFIALTFQVYVHGWCTKRKKGRIILKMGEALVFGCWRICNRKGNSSETRSPPGEEYLFLRFREDEENGLSQNKPNEYGLKEIRTAGMFEIATGIKKCFSRG